MYSKNLVYNWGKTKLIWTKVTKLLIINLFHISSYLLNCVVHNDSVWEVIIKKFIYLFYSNYHWGDEIFLCLETRITERHANAQMGEQLIEKEDFGEPLKTRINSE